VYSKNLAFLSVGSLQQRGIEMLILLLQNFSGFALGAAFIGGYLVLRHQHTRRYGVFLVLVVSLGAGFRAWMGSVLGNPDVLGYLGPACMAIGMLAALCFALVACVVQAHWPRARAGIAVAAMCLPWLVAVGARASMPRASLANFTATDVFDDLRFRTLPPRSVVLAGTAQTTFRYVEFDTVEVARPDLTMVPMSFLRYPGTADLLMKRAPQAAPLVRAYLAHDAVPEDDIMSLSRTRPVFVELDAHTPSALYAVLSPSHLMHRVLARFDHAPNTLDSMREQRATIASVYAGLGRDLLEVETARQLLWMHYMDALYFASLGHRALAREALAHAHALQPDDADVAALAAVLNDPRVTGGIPVERFLHLDLSGR
jgi:hypothetical protein